LSDSTPIVLLDIEDHVATVTLNRPAARTALSRELTYALWDTVAAAGAGPSVAVVILTGADPAFCAGIDLSSTSR
jgi:enoyl-CoA hydratase